MAAATPEAAHFIKKFVVLHSLPRPIRAQVMQAGSTNCNSYFGPRQQLFRLSEMTQISVNSIYGTATGSGHAAFRGLLVPDKKQTDEITWAAAPRSSSVRHRVLTGMRGQFAQRSNLFDADIAGCSRDRRRRGVRTLSSTMPPSSANRYTTTIISKSPKSLASCKWAISRGGKSRWLSGNCSGGLKLSEQHDDYSLWRT